MRRPRRFSPRAIRRNHPSGYRSTTTTAPRPRFSVRIGRAEPAFDGPFEDVPEHLLVPLQEWVNGVPTCQGSPQEGMTRPICLRLRVLPSQGHYGEALYAVPLVRAAGAQRLDVVDEVLRSRSGLERKVGLSGNCLMTLDLPAGQRGADGSEERVTPAVGDAVRHTIADAAAGQFAGSAADHLATAWQAAYGRSRMRCARTAKPSRPRSPRPTPLAEQRQGHPRHHDR
ncbi:hypothetical protein GCM10010273_56470 [Streptomyces lavendulocolor]